MMNQEQALENQGCPRLSSTLHLILGSFSSLCGFSLTRPGPSVVSIPGAVCGCLFAQWGSTAIVGVCVFVCPG